MHRYTMDIEGLENRRLLSVAPLPWAVAAPTASAASSLSPTFSVGSLLPSPGTLQVTLPTASGVNTAGGINVEVSRVLGSAGSVSVQFATSNGTATAGADYAATSGTLTFADGETAKTVFVPFLNNATAPALRTFNLTLSNVSGGALLGLAATTVVTVQNLQSVVQVQQASQSVVNTQAAATVTLTRAGNTALPAIVHYTTQSVDAVAGVDYSAVAGFATFLAGQTTASVLVPLLSNASGAASSSVSLVLDAAGEATVLGQQVAQQITLTNPNSLIRVARSELTAVTSAGFAAVQVVRSGNTALAGSVAYTTQAVTSNAASAYSAVSGTLNFAAGEVSKVINVPLTQGALGPASAVLNLVLSSPGVNTILSTLATTGITLVDAPSTIETASAQVLTDHGGPGVDISVTRSGNVSLAVSVDYETADGTAVAGLDYAVTRGTLSFAAGETSKLVHVPVLSHLSAQALTLFNVTLSNVRGGGVLGPQNVTGVSVANSSSVIQFDSASVVATPNATSVDITLVRAGNLDAAATASFHTADGTARSGTDYTAIQGTVEFAAGEATRVVTVALSGSAGAQQSTAFAVTLDAANGNGSVGPVSETDVTLQNTLAEAGFAVTAIQGVESEGVATIDLYRVGNLSEAASVDVVSSGGTATPGVDYLPVATTVTFAPGETTASVAVSIASDTLTEGHETVELNLARPSDNLVLAVPSATLTIADPVQAAKVTDVLLANSNTPVADASGVFSSVSIRLDKPLSAPPSVDDFTLYRRLRDRPAGGGLAKPVKLASVDYDSASNSVLLRSLKPLKANRFYQLVAKPGRLKDSDGLDVGGPSGDSSMSFYFGSGSKLKYVDRDGDTVTLSVRGAGSLRLTRRSDGEGDVLTVNDANPSTVVLATVVQGSGGNGASTLTGIQGIDVSRSPLPIVASR